jgi:hypothetical protein
MSRDNGLQEYTHLVMLPNLTNKIFEGFIHVDTLFRGRLDELAVEMLGKIPTLCVQA